jgi:hypothetical protein
MMNKLTTLRGGIYLCLSRHVLNAKTCKLIREKSHGHERKNEAHKRGDRKSEAVTGVMMATNFLIPWKVV